MLFFVIVFFFVCVCVCYCSVVKDKLFFFDVQLRRSMVKCQAVQTFKVNT